MVLVENMGRILSRYWGLFLEGTANTLLYSAITVAMGVVLGSLLALMRLSKWKVGSVHPLGAIATAYVEVIRGTPLLLQLYLFYFLLPMLIPALQTGKVFSCLLALCLNSGAYVAEIIRAGIRAVDKGQTEAARSLGLNARQTLQKVVFPQAIKNILPAIGNEFVVMVKETSIIQYLGISDIMYNNGIVVTTTYNPLPCYYISALIYLALNIILGRGLNIFERRMKRNER